MMKLFLLVLLCCVFLIFGLGKATEIPVYPDLNTEMKRQYYSKDSNLIKSLEADINQFLGLLKSNNLKSSQTMLHPNGVYYYTLGKIKPTNFNQAMLFDRTGPLHGAYLYELPDDFEGPDSMVPGTFWLNSLRVNYTEEPITWYNGYSSVAYGFTGNYSSDHIYWDGGMPYTPDSINIKVAYISHNDKNIGNRDILMLEFFPDKNNNWKIYAIGNLEWTP